VQAALIQPTGDVSPGTAAALLSHWQSFARIQAAFESILFIGSAAGQPCLTGSADAGTYDLTCLPLGQPVRGRLVFDAHASTVESGAPLDAGVEGDVDAVLEDACVGDSCLHADIQMSVIPSDCGPLATLAVTATVSSAGQTGTDTFSFGVQGGMGRGEFMARVVYFDADGRSFLVDGGSGDASSSVLLSGANGSFECSLQSGGLRCSGATSFTLP
jgi:hypothetical protein